jgi:hypothetical protein
MAMPCDHLQPQDVMMQAEEWLQRNGIGRERWGGARVRHGENTPDGMWASIVMELERRGDEWIVTRLDRNREPIAERDCGLQVVV